MTEFPWQHDSNLVSDWCMGTNNFYQNEMPTKIQSAGISTINNVLVQILPGSTLLQEFQQRIREKKEKNPLNLFWLCRVKPKMSESLPESEHF